MLLYPAPYGGLTSLWAATTDEGADLNGKVRSDELRTVSKFLTFLIVPYSMGQDWQARCSR